MDAATVATVTRANERLYIVKDQKYHAEKKLNNINKEIEDLKALLQDCERKQKAQKAQKAKKTSKPTSLRGPKAKKCSSCGSLKL